MKWTWIILAGVLVLLFAGGGMAASSGGDRIARIADAIAYAEGFYVPGSRPQRNNNPGDLTGDIGFNYVGYDGIYVIFKTIADGWNALKKQVELMLTNQSRVYNSSMTIREVAGRYTTTDQDAWAQNVASRLGVTIDTRISEV